MSTNELENAPDSPLAPAGIENNEDDGGDEPGSPLPPGVESEANNNDEIDDEAKIEALFEDEDEDDQQQPEVKQQKKRKRKTEKTSKKRRRILEKGDLPPVENGEVAGQEQNNGEYDDGDNNEDAGAVAGTGYEEMDKERMYEKEFQDMVASVRPKRRTKSDKEKPQEAENLAQVIERMDAACEQDREAIKEKKPALNKIQMLPEVISWLQKDFVREGSFDSNLLSMCYKWLKPLADGTLPNLRVREGILKCLGRIDIAQESLQASGLGKVIMVLSKHKEETAQNKRLCKELIAKWSRPIFEIKSSFREYPGDGEPSQPTRMLPTASPGNQKKRKRVSAGGKALDEVLESGPEGGSSEKQQQLGKLYYNRPDKVKMDYSKQPSFTWTEGEKKKQEKKVKSGLQESMATLKARPAAKRAMDVGINRVNSNV